MKFRIGYRTIKTAVGAGVAIWIAQLFQLQFFAFAGIITILCIQPTKKKSYQIAFERFFASVMGLGIAAICFEGIGYSPWTITIILLVSIPIMVSLKVKEGIVSSSVIMLHLFTAQKATWDILLNEIYLLLIGVGVALIANQYMPNVEQKLKKYQMEIEENFKKIFTEVIVYIREGDSLWDGREITETARLLKEAKQLALHNLENYAYEEEQSYYQYFLMREQQFEIIERILPIISSLPKTYVQGHQIADFIDQLKESIHPGNTADIHLQSLNVMQNNFREQPLPVDREEFETRASLFVMVKDMRRYLQIKKKMAKIDGDQKDISKRMEGNTQESPK
ncbi:aromatic acid exporter family protein [Risungbinella massiliensis]|uniref:aromatic acid exporter family protein n=1 Tax=Risungbinella massiliensis TaxID=1329796 RepID=UPI0005CC737C|nr:aromatic acid exporter family protein [Risungbinella massiliensis]